jgi:predicted PurR-regulated permease PerM
MPPEERTIAASPALVTIAAFVVITAGMRAAAPILQPFLLAAFLSVILAPPYFWLERHRVPTVLALVIVIGGVTIVGVSMGMIVGTSVNSFIGNQELYDDLNREWELVLRELDQLHIDFPEHTIADLLSPKSVMQLAANLLTSLSGVLSYGFLILITVVFVLLEASVLNAKLRKILPNPEKSLPRVEAILKNLKRYTVIKTVMSFTTGVLITLGLWFMELEYAALWGLIAFMFNFIPNIGSIIAAIPAVMLALVQLGPLPAVGVAGVYLLINGVIGNVIEPRYMGRGLGLSTLVVFLSMVFWGWVLGPIGMLLSVPLTMTLKIVLDGFDDTRWAAVLLGGTEEFDEME